MAWAYSIFKFFASLRLGVFLLITLGVIFGVGTFVESYHGAEAAKLLVYFTPWMSVFLVLLSLNLLASALDRWPWKKKHTGFLTTHLGIILILFGSLISQSFGVEGQLAIAEGETGNRMTLQRPFFQVANLQQGMKWIFPIRPKPLAWQGDELLRPTTRGVPFDVHLTHDYPKARQIDSVRQAVKGPAAIRARLKGSMAEIDQWLFLDDPKKDTIELGPAQIRFLRHEPKVLKHGKEGMLHFQFDSGELISIPVEKEKLNQVMTLRQLPIHDTDYLVTIKRILKDARVDGKQLVERSDEWLNPAVELVLAGKDFKEPHTVFAKFPEFPTVHGLKPSHAGVKITYEVGEIGAQEAKNALHFFYNGDGPLTYMAKRGNDVKRGEVQIGQERETGWMDFKFTVLEYMEASEMDARFEPLPNLTEAIDARPVIAIQLKKGPEFAKHWFPQGDIKEIEWAGQTYHMAYGLMTRPLGFALQLKDFVVETDPGTERAAAFKSEVILKDSSKGIEREVTIQMNEPLIYRGYKIYQSAYLMEPGKPETSIFTVARDPGNPIKYAGSIIMLGGILMLFYAKPFSTLKTSDPNERIKDKK